MKIFLLIPFLLAFTSSFGANIIIELRSAHEQKVLPNATVRTYNKNGEHLGDYVTNNQGQFKMHFKKHIEVKIEPNNLRYTPKTITLSKWDKNFEKKIIKLYHSEQYEKQKLIEEGCEIRKKKTLETLEAESEETQLKVEEDELDVDASFPGGEEEMKQFMVRNIYYPEESMERGESGKVYIEFIVNKDGEIGCVQPLNEVPWRITLEAMRIIRLMPKWEPAYSNGNVVRARCRIPINFKLM